MVPLQGSLMSFVNKERFFDPDTAVSIDHVSDTVFDYLRRVV